MRFLALSLLVLILLAPIGCSSLDHALFRDEPLEMYGGTKYSWNYITKNTTEDTTILGNIAYSIDFPFTVIMDTLILPISAPIELTR